MYIFNRTNNAVGRVASITTSNYRARRPGNFSKRTRFIIADMLTNSKETKK